MPTVTRALRRLAGSALIVGVSLAALSTTPDGAFAASAPVSKSAPSHRHPKADRFRRATFSVQPATNGKPDQRSTLSYTATPGATITDHVGVINYSLHRMRFAVYAADAVNDSAGNLTLSGPGHKSIDVGSWVSIGGRAKSGSLTLKPRSYAIVPIRVHVPNNASPGDHVGGVVADLVTTSKRRGVDVRLHQRVGPAVFVRVSGEVTPALSIEDLSATYTNNWNPIGEGSATISYVVRNIGNVNLGASQEVVLGGLFGQSITVRPRAIPLLLPGGDTRVSVHVPGVFPEFRTSVKVTLKPLVPAGNLDTGVHTYTAETSFRAIPWLLIAIAAVLLAVVAALWMRRRRARRRRPGGPPRSEGRSQEPELVPATHAPKEVDR